MACKGTDTKLSGMALQVSDGDNNEEGDDENEDCAGLELNQARCNKRKANRSHSARTLAKGNTRPCKMFKSECGGRRRRPPSHNKKLSLTATPPVAATFPSMGPNLSIMTSGLDSSPLTSQTMAAAAANASLSNSGVPASQSPQLTQAAFAAATAALATAAAAAGMPVNQLITQVSQMTCQ